ncbi:hypothetical protein FRC00_000004 [Tulasnella sp. 408]|nr:hypothetical protein FRC00_000004 [Tulasnella sp. 408]
MSDKDALFVKLREKAALGLFMLARIAITNLPTEGDTVIYTEIPHKQIGPKAAYFISSDGKRVYGKVTMVTTVFCYHD